MFCPSCRSEFRPGIDFCRNCEVSLLNELPDQSIFHSSEAMATALEGRELRPILVASHVELVKVQTQLGGHQIPSLLANEDGGDFQPGIASRFFLMVAEEDAQKAIQFVNNSALEGFKREGLVEKLTLGNTSECPACASEVPASSEECPECGLFLGLGEDQ